MRHKVKPGRIDQNTFLIDIYVNSIPQGTSIFAVKADKTALIDGGTSAEANGIIKTLSEFDLLPIDYIIVTHAHWDHHQAIPAILEATSGKRPQVLAHPNAIPLLKDPSKVGYDFGMCTVLPIEDVKPVDEGDVIDLEGAQLEVVSTPGHTADSISLLDRKNSNLFVSDAVSYKPVREVCLPVIMPPSFDPRKYEHTLEKLKRYDFDNLCFGHYGVYYGSDVKELLHEARIVYERVWQFFDEHVDRLLDFEWVAKSYLERDQYMRSYLEKTCAGLGVSERVGFDDFAQHDMKWMTDAYMMYRKSHPKQ